MKWRRYNQMPVTKLTPSQQAMVEDGMPPSLFFTEEERQAAWEKNLKENPWYKEPRDLSFRIKPSGNDVRKPRKGDGNPMADKNETQATETAAPVDSAQLSKLVKDYNALVEEAKALGLSDYRPVTTFKTVEMGEQRFEKIASSIRAVKDGHAADARRAKGKPSKDDEEDTNVATKKTATKTKAKTAPKKGNSAANSVSVPKTDYKPGSPVAANKLLEAVLGSRQESHKATVLTMLIDNIRKPVTASKLMKACYNKDMPGPFSAVIGGIRNKFTALKVPYAIEVNTEGKDTTYTLRPGK